MNTFGRNKPKRYKCTCCMGGTFVVLYSETFSIKYTFQKQTVDSIHVVVVVVVAFCRCSSFNCCKPKNANREKYALHLKVSNQILIVPFSRIEYTSYTCPPEQTDHHRNSYLFVLHGECMRIFDRPSLLL